MVQIFCNNGICFEFEQAVQVATGSNPTQEHWRDIKASTWQKLSSKASARTNDDSDQTVTLPCLLQFFLCTTVGLNLTQVDRYLIQAHRGSTDYFPLFWLSMYLFYRK